MKKFYGIVLGLVFFFCAAAVQAQCTLEEALDAPELTWSTGGDAEWFCQGTESYYGGTSAQSGPFAVGETGNSYLETEVTVDELQVLAFHWKVDFPSTI